MRRLVSLFVLLGASLSPVVASALVTPHRPGGGTSGPLEASGALVAPAGVPPLRHEVATHYGPAPRALADAWATFLADTTSPRWQALWDSDTRRPLRLFGGFAEAPGTSASAAAAEEHARAFLARHGALLLAGRSIDDFDLVTSHQEHGLRTVGFQQFTTAGGVKVPVLSGRVNVRYKADRLFVLGAEALPVLPFGAPQKAAEEARAAALSHLAPAQPHAAVLGADLVALPLVRKGTYRVVLAWRVSTESASPPSRTDVFVDARDASILATKENIRFLTGSLKYEAPVRGPQEHALYPAPAAALAIDGAPNETDASGSFSIDPAPSSVACFASSDVVAVVNLGGDAASLTFVPADGDEVVWSLADDELGDAQLSAFVHTSIAKDHARKIDPGMSFLDKALSVRVNQDDPAFGCNAYWNGFNLNFFQQFQTCNNTARVADVVYHEFGHAFHTNSILMGVGEYDAALGEGGADYYASIVTNDPYLGPGFFQNGEYLREFDTDLRWPEDISWDPHETGLIFAGALWDLRTLLTDELGPDEGAALTHQLYQASLRRSPSLPAAFPEILAADDDDGDLGNGTPHVCQIVKAFAPHGLTPYISPSGLTMTHVPPRVAPSDQESYEIAVETVHAFPQCAVTEEADGVMIKWRTQINGGAVPMTRESSKWVGHLPGQIPGTQIRYSLIAGFDGLESVLPRNLADPEYKLFVGDTTPLYCTDFEQADSGWIFGEVNGKSTDFGAGAPQGGGGDPEAAFSGQSVIGTTLAEPGRYRDKRTSFAESPPIDLGEHTRVRLQFMRWLTVEDGAYDQARVVVDGQQLWVNGASDTQEYTLPHEDLEWRFEDLDIGNAGGDHTVTVRFELQSDEDIEYGGWNIDDVCVVAWDPPSSGGSGGAGGSGGGGGAGGAGAAGTADAGCACSTTAPAGDVPWGAAFALAALSLLRRRRSPGGRA